jgi:amino acid transporter
MYKKARSWKYLVGSKKIAYWLIAICVSPFSSYAQCAMCRASLQGEANTAKAEAVNDGIVYLMVIPYLLVAIMGIFIYRMYKKK